VGVITKVDEQRWRKAQEWERRYWESKDHIRNRFGLNKLWPLIALTGYKPAYRGDDWNAWWRDHFEGYGFLPPRCENAIELGCGPYTNMRMLLAGTYVDYIYLLDPLMPVYRTFANTFASKAARQYNLIFDPHPIETCPYGDPFFDVVVMINVLDHVMDAELCMQKAVSMTKAGGILIVGQDLSNEEDIRRLSTQSHDVGHPIKVDHAWMEERLLGSTEVILHHILDRSEGREPDHHYGTLIYAGRKR